MDNDSAVGRFQVVQTRNEVHWFRYEEVMLEMTVPKLALFSWWKETMVVVVQIRSSILQLAAVAEGELAFWLLVDHQTGRKGHWREMAWELVLEATSQAWWKVTWPRA